MTSVTTTIGHAATRDRQQGRLIRLFGVAATIFVVFLVCLLAVRIYTAREAGGRTAASHFELIHRELADVYVANGSVQSPVFRDKVSSLEGEAGLVALMLRGPEGVRYAFDNTWEIIKLADGKLVELRVPSLHQEFSSSFPAEPATILTAVYRLVTRDHAFRIVRDALFLVIAFLLACAIALLLVVTLTPHTTSEDNTPWPNGPLGEDAEVEALPPQPAAVHVVALEPQEALRERLGAELERAIAFETDLSLALGVLLAAEATTDDTAARLAGRVRELAMLPELGFAYGESGFGLILPETNLDTAIALLERWRRAAVDAGLRIAIGIGDRAARNLDGERLLMEVEHALGRAMANGGYNLVAFRADPQRYRVLQAAARR